MKRPSAAEAHAMRGAVVSIFGQLHTQWVHSEMSLSFCMKNQGMAQKIADLEPPVWDKPPKKLIKKQYVYL
jgi:hypothetical protein